MAPGRIEDEPCACARAMGHSACVRSDHVVRARGATWDHVTGPGIRRYSINGHTWAGPGPPTWPVTLPPCLAPNITVGEPELTVHQSRHCALLHSCGAEVVQCSILYTFRMVSCTREPAVSYESSLLLCFLTWEWGKIGNKISYHVEMRLCGQPLNACFVCTQCPRSCVTFSGPIPCFCATHPQHHI